MPSQKLQVIRLIHFLDVKVVTTAQFEGCWISENDNKKIECNFNDDNTWLLCTWQNEYVEIFQFENKTLVGVTNPEIIGYPASQDINGYPAKLDRISWNTGNRWLRKGM